MSADGRAGSVNRNAFVGANLGVHASPLEAITSMDPKDYVWGGGYDTSCYGSQPPAFAAQQHCYYPQASNHGNFGQYGYAQQYTQTTGISAGNQAYACSANSLVYPSTASDSSRGKLYGHADSLCDAQDSENEGLVDAAPLDSKVDDLLELDEADLKKMLSPDTIDEAADFATEDSGSCKRVRQLESVASGDSHMSGSEEVILPDFGEGFGNSDGMLLEASPLSDGPLMDGANPYLSPLLGPPTLSAAIHSPSKASEERRTHTDRPVGHGSKESVKRLLSEMSMADAVQCINQFLRTDKRIANERRQVAVSAVQAICPSKSLVVTLRQHVPVVKAQLKRKRSSSKALEAARNSQLDLS